MFSFRDESSHLTNDTSDALNSNYRLTISPLPKLKQKAKGAGLVSIVSADTHIALNTIKNNRSDKRPTTQSSLAYNISVDNNADPRRALLRGEVDEETKVRVRSEGICNIWDHGFNSGS